MSDKVFLHIGFHGLKKEIFTATFNQDLDQEILNRFKACLPFTASGPAHSVSSGQNIVCVIPDTKFVNYLSQSSKTGTHSRSKAKPGSLFMRYSQIACFMYDKSQDHGVYMPCILQVKENQIERLKKTCRKFWDIQSLSDKKLVLSIDFSLEEHTSNSFLPKLNYHKTTNNIVDEAIEKIFKQTSNIWLYPPHDIIEFIKYGNKNKKEGTDGYLFPMNIIFYSVIMLIANFAHASPINFIQKLVEDLENKKANKEQMNCVIDFVCYYIEVQLTYLRSIDVGSFVSVCEIYCAALKVAKNSKEIKALTDAFVLFGAKVHMWATYFFPFYTGAQMQYSNTHSFLPQSISKIYKNSEPKLPIDKAYEFFKNGFLLIKNTLSGTTGKYLQKNQHLIELAVFPLLGKKLKFVKKQVINMHDLKSWKQMISYYPQINPNSISIMIPIEVKDIKFEFIVGSHSLGTYFKNKSSSNDITNIVKQVYPRIEQNITYKLLTESNIICIDNLTIFRSLVTIGKSIILMYETN